MKEYIERERLKEAFHADLQSLQSVDEHTMNLILIEIDEVSVADVAPMRHGIWLKLSGGSPYCSICGAVERDTYDAVTEECKYCYSCGSRMDGKDDKYEI